jgi:acyl-coenzyme A synthetase/AMP-(fatty) acid ligase
MDAPNQWVHVLNDGPVKLLFCAGELVRAVDELRPSLDAVEGFVTLDDADGASGWEVFADWLAEQPTTPIERPVADTETLHQIHTSGTTGQPTCAIARLEGIGERRDHL